jgi:hypothetical protein
MSSVGKRSSDICDLRDLSGFFKDHTYETNKIKGIAKGNFCDEFDPMG